MFCTQAKFMIFFGFNVSELAFMCFGFFIVDSIVVISSVVYYVHNLNMCPRDESESLEKMRKC